MRRYDLGDNIVEIRHSDGSDRWLVIKKMLDASKISLQAKSGVDVESTEIALAFPMKPSAQRTLSQVCEPFCLSVIGPPHEKTNNVVSEQV